MSTVLTSSEQSLIDAVRAPGTRTIVVEAKDSEIRELLIDEPVAFDGSPPALTAVIARLMSEAPNQDVVVRKRDGKLGPILRRVLRFRYPSHRTGERD